MVRTGLCDSPICTEPEKVTISIQHGCVNVKSNPDNVTVEVHDYDILEIDLGDDRKYGKDKNGDYLITNI